MNKKRVIIVITIIVILLIILGIIKIFNKNEKKNDETNKIETVISDNGFEAYSISNIHITNSNANLIFLDDIDGKGQDELIVREGDIYTFNKYGERKIQVLELTDDYITISIDGLAPTKESGGHSLIDKYDKVTIKKNTGICLNVQATDLLNGSVYLFYVNQ